MEYTTVIESSEYKLREKVTEMIKMGWRPQGGISFVFHSGYKETWAQAMVKK